MYDVKKLYIFPAVFLSGNVKNVGNYKENYRIITGINVYWMHKWQ